MFRRDLQITAHVVLNQLLHVFGALDSQVVAQARADQDFLNPFQGPAAAVHFDERAVIGGQVLADAGVDAAGLAAGRFNFWRFTTQAVHIGCGATQIGNGSGKTFDLVANVFNLFNHRIFRAALDDAAFVLGDGAKRAAPKTTAHDVDAKTDHLPRRNFGCAVMAALGVSVNGVRAAGVGKVKNHVHFGRCQRNWWRGNPNVARGHACAVGLNQGPGVAGVGF